MDFNPKIYSGVKAGEIITGVITVLLVILKISGVIKISWWWAISPILILIAGVILFFGLLVWAMIHSGF